MTTSPVRTARRALPPLVAAVTVTAAPAEALPDRDAGLTVTSRVLSGPLPCGDCADGFGREVEASPALAGGPGQGRVVVAHRPPAAGWTTAAAATLEPALPTTLGLPATIAVGRTPAAYDFAEQVVTLGSDELLAASTEVDQADLRTIAPDSLAAGDLTSAPIVQRARRSTDGGRTDRSDAVLSLLEP